MPWRETAPMDQRTQFIADHLRATQTITELCDRYGVSRKTGYKWIDRYLRRGPAGLENHSRRPHRAPNQTADDIVAAILEARQRHPAWGGLGDCAVDMCNPCPWTRLLLSPRPFTS
jgi:putative transposase